MVCIQSRAPEGRSKIMKRISIVPTSIVGLLAVVSVDAQGEQVAAPANRRGAPAVVDANGNLQVPADYRTAYQFFG